MIKTTRSRREAIPSTTEDSSDIAEVLLERLGEVRFQGGREIRYRDPKEGKLVRIHRDSDGRIFFQTPNSPKGLFKRVSPDRSNKLLSDDNRNKLNRFLESNPLVLSLMDYNKIRYAK